MEVLIKTLCDGAFNYGGKLTIVGTYDQLIVDSVPWKGRVNFAIKLFIPINEVHAGSKFRVEFKDEQNNPVSSPLSNTVPFPDTNADFHLALAGSMELTVSELGTHKMCCYVDDTLVFESKFKVAEKNK